MPYESRSPRSAAAPAVESPSEARPPERRRLSIPVPSWRQALVGCLLAMGALVVLSLLATLLLVLLMLPFVGWGEASDGWDLMAVDALSAAGAFGRGANGQMIRSVSAVTDAIKNNLLGLVGATFVLVILGLAAGHIFGDQRAQEKTMAVVKGVFMLVAATGFVA